MALILNGSANTLTGLAVGGLPDGSVASADLADNAVTSGKLASGLSRKILGMNSVTYEDQQRTVSSTSWVDSGMEITYTPTASNSTALISLFAVARGTTSQYLYFQLRQADAVWAGGSAGGDEYVPIIIGNVSHWSNVSATWHVSPTWTADTATSFQIYVMKHTSSQGDAYLGWGSGLNTKGTYKDGLIIQEVAA